MESLDLFWLFLYSALIVTITYSFTKHVMENQLTQDWEHGEWASFRFYKKIHEKPNLTVFEYSNQRLKQQHEEIDELLKKHNELDYEIKKILYKK